MVDVKTIVGGQPIEVEEYPKTNRFRKYSLIGEARTNGGYHAGSGEIHRKSVARPMKLPDAPQSAERPSADIDAGRGGKEKRPHPDRPAAVALRLWQIGARRYLERRSL